MCRVCANAALAGQSSAAAIVQLIHETKGFILLDDMESIGKRLKRETTAKYSELMQTLKISYNKETSWKVWSDVRRGMRPQRINFFGVKMINNTSGTDDILGSRMLTIRTEKMPPAGLEQMKRLDTQNEINTAALCNELHTWTFENVALINTTYQRLFPQPSDRAAEISAPLRVFAEITGDDELTKGLEAALSVKNEETATPADPIELMMQAVRNIVRAGYRRLSTTHVVLEMKTIERRRSLPRQPYHFQPEKWESPAWVGRQLRTYDLVEINAEASWQWLFGKSLRIYAVKEEFRRKIYDENDSSQAFLEKEPLDFCKGYAGCHYQESNCPIMSSRLRAEGSNSGVS
jgi:hypothetical protein